MFGFALIVTLDSSAKSGDDALRPATHFLSASKLYSLPSGVLPTARPWPVSAQPGATLPPRALTLKPSPTTRIVRPSVGVVGGRTDAPPAFGGYVSIIAVNVTVT